MVSVQWEDKWKPFCNPLQGIVTSSCGTRQNPVLGKQEFHDGIDIAAAVGTDVLAVKDGMVTNIRNSNTFGLVLEYETKDGFFVKYAHLDAVLVQKGDTIKQGQPIAKSGNSGLSTGPHLHYTVKKDDMILDPLPFVDLPYTKETEAEYQARGQNIADVRAKK